MDKIELFFYHKPDNSNVKKKEKLKRRAVIAGIIVDGKLRLGMAECSLRDQFNKKVGREKALGRAKSKQRYILEVSAEEKVVRQFLDTAKKVAKDL